VFVSTAEPQPPPDVDVDVVPLDPELEPALASIAAQTDDQRPFATSTVTRIPRLAKMTPPSFT
jgi:hypothetical protein